MAYEALKPYADRRITVRRAQQQRDFVAAREAGREPFKVADLSLAELGRSLRRRWRWAWSIGLQRHLESTRRLWTTESPCPVPSLRGALMAVSREALDRFGPFDEGYFLYYEETDWLWRARRAGAALGIAPAARPMRCKLSWRPLRAPSE